MKIDASDTIDRRIRHNEDRRGRHDDDHRGRDEDRHSRHGDDRNMRRDETRSRKEYCNEIEIYIDSKRLYDFICQTIVDDDIVSKKILKNNKKFKIKFEGRRLERSENKNQSMFNCFIIFFTMWCLL